MNQESFSVLGLTFVLVAAAGVLAMLELWGNQQTRINKTFLRIAHRSFGYIFIAIYALMVYFMLARIASQTEPFTPLQTVHMALALMILPILAIKILILRRLPALEEKLPYLGITIFTIAFTLNALTAGFYFVKKLNPRYVSLQFFDRSKLSMDLGRGLLEARCQKCHTLERVFLAVKTEPEWEKTVNAMVSRDPSISNDEAAQIIFYLANARSVKEASQAVTLARMQLTDSKCGRCHMLDRLYRQKRPANEWSIIVDRMVSIEPAWISLEEARSIKTYLSESHSAPKRTWRFEEKPVPKRVEPPKERVLLSAQEIFESTCAACHTHDRVYKKSEEIGTDKDKWQIIIERMRKNGADLSDDDIANVVDFLSNLQRP